MAAYQLICFDAGFTLLQPRMTMPNLLAEALRANGLAPTEEALHRAWEAADRWFWDDYHRPDNHTWRSDAGIHATWRQYHGLMLRELGVDDPEHRIADATIETQDLPDRWQLYPDVEPALRALEGRGLQLAIISDWSSRLPAILAEHGIAGQFQFVLASGAVGAAKPSPELYRMALERAGVAPEAALMVGDSYRADVLGARSVGMAGVLLDRAGGAANVDGPVIRSLVELAALLAG
jgi:putative hydrolase of the HAD superfamily